ncbi:hypothetical protein NDU88_003292 [Pleurodeles waltl]|uniref:Uncharacterized protein n=1 Tax=Pleurodeles waltl TaxID=8319 RepID=A0AAV7TQN0_PLEWA|nr:hypothetical protein NDU88_003292 [Pleurodeles waltl]
MPARSLLKAVPAPRCDQSFVRVEGAASRPRPHTTPSLLATEPDLRPVPPTSQSSAETHKDICALRE